MSEWQPIETAPKDKIILLLNGNRISSAKYNKFEEKWFTHSYSEFLFPTHWKPLPDLPKDE